ncbi:MAG: DUF1573 domain-containing protein [Planctomycetes bacterium]|nr:DUF1573 domain-containing protein [Planctomycetota bacterium]
MRKVVLALFVGSWLASSASAQPAAWADKLFAGETTHDFGTVARAAQLKFAFKMTNIYKVPLDITDVRVSCGCVKAEAGLRTLQPGETGTLNVSMDARQFIGSKTVRVYVTVGPKYISTATLTVSANAKGEVAFTPHEVDFGTVQRGQAPSKSIDIEYSGGKVDWRVLEIVKSSGAPFDLKAEELPRLPNGLPRRGYRLHAAIKADPAANGSFKQEIVLKTNDPTAPMLSFNIVGHIQSGLAVSPSPIVVRDLKVGESQTKKVFVTASRPFRVLAVDGQGEGITVEVPKTQDAMIVLTVHIAPTKAGELRKQLTIRTDIDNATTPLVIEANIAP